jgi:hypothetical protein
MKQLELNLNKRLLIVESLSNVGVEKKELIKSLEDRFDCKLELLGLGSELTEEIAKALVTEYAYGYYKNYNTSFCGGRPKTSLDFKTSLESFISAIEAQSYYWGENPHMNKDSRFNTNRPVCFLGTNDCRNIIKEKYCQCYSYREAESKTFNPEKTLIFEIL